ncbi:MAG TPA: hypothetical protein VFV87_04835, partial [Pirellulaceae bacterium]|nr:hypothetical protein [Pirellulaceae bacterium]
RPESAGEAVTMPLSPRDTGSQDEEALQHYMDRFLERVTGKKKSDGETTPDPAVTVVAASAPQEPEKPREIKRPPDSVQDLSQMRALANQSAREALGIHTGRQIATSARTAGLVALFLAGFSSILAASHLAMTASWMWLGSLAIVPLTLFMTWRFFRLRGQLLRLEREEATA